MAFDPAAWIAENAQGAFVEQDVLGVIGQIQEYDQNLVVQYLDPDSFPDATDAPYRIMEVCPDGQRRLVFSVWKLDGRVLERLYDADTRKHDVLGRMERQNQGVRLGAEKRYKEDMGALHELAFGVLRSPKDTYTATNPLTGEKHTFRSIPRSD